MKDIETQPGSPNFDGAEAFEAFQAAGGYAPAQEDVYAALSDADQMNTNMRLHGTIDAPEALDLTDVLSAMLWLYHRLPRAYGRVRLIEEPIAKVAKVVGMTVDGEFSQREAK